MDENISDKKENQVEPSNPHFHAAVHHQRNIIISILLFFILAGIAAFVYAVFKPSQKQVEVKKITSVNLPTPSPTPANQITDMSNWKTYTNTQYGVNFKYPENWSVEVNGPESIGIRQSKNSLYSIVGSIPTNKEIENIKNTDVSSKYVTITQRQFTLNGYPVIEYTDKTDENAPVYGAGMTTIQTLIENGDKKFLFNLSDYQYKQIFDQILSTFKFTQ